MMLPTITYMHSFHMAIALHLDLRWPAQAKNAGHLLRVFFGEFVRALGFFMVVEIVVDAGSAKTLGIALTTQRHRHAS